MRSLAVVVALTMAACGPAEEEPRCWASVEARCGSVLTCTADRVVEVACEPAVEWRLVCFDPGACR